MFHMYVERNLYCIKKIVEEGGSRCHICVVIVDQQHCGDPYTSAAATNASILHYDYHIDYIHRSRIAMAHRTGLIHNTLQNTVHSIPKIIVQLSLARLVGWFVGWRQQLQTKRHYRLDSSAKIFLGSLVVS